VPYSTRTGTTVYSSRCVCVRELLAGDSAKLRLGWTMPCDGFYYFGALVGTHTILQRVCACEDRECEWECRCGHDGATTAGPQTGFVVRIGKRGAQCRIPKFLVSRERS
jgi:hypothetical protein